MTELDLMLMPEVAEDTRLTVDTLRYLRHIGTGPPSFKLGRRVVYRREAVQAWVSQREAEASKA